MSDEQVLQLVFDPAGLAPGIYYATLVINTSDPLNPVFNLPVTFTISSGIPAAPQLFSVGTTAGAYVFQLQGDTGVPYVVQTSSNLVTWTSVSTNTLPGGVLNFTNPIAPGSARQFWRALWQP
jgi:hypothetical protein